MSHRTGMSRGVLLLALLCAVSFGAIVRVALAGDNYHVTCVEHGFYGGSDTTDGSYFARVNAGCSSTYRYCGIMAGAYEVGSDELYTSTGTCNSWSRTYGDYTECVGGANLNDPGSFSQHYHLFSGSC
jgi:hypothetical protein